MRRSLTDTVKRLSYTKYIIYCNIRAKIPNDSHLDILN